MTITEIIGLIIVIGQIIVGLLMKNLSGRMQGIKDLLQKDINGIAETFRQEITHINDTTGLRKATRDEQIHNIKEDIVEIKEHIKSCTKQF